MYTSGSPAVQLWNYKTKANSPFTDSYIPIGQLPKTLWLEGKDASLAVRGFTFTCHYGVCLSVRAFDKAKVTFLELDLAAQDLDGAVDETHEENPGAYVHYNVDNDNANVTPGGDPIADATETNTVAGENDLKKATAKVDPLPDTGVVALKRNGSRVKVWKTATKGSGEEILTADTEKTWDLSVPAQRNEFNAVRNNLYVEGYEAGADQLSLEYRLAAMTLRDKVKYTFIAALCGDQPKPTQRTRFSGWLSPGLTHCEWSITAAATGVYNCIAWSVDETSTWYDPVWSVPHYGIVGIDEEYGDASGTLEDADMDAFYLDKKSYTPTASGPEDANVMYYQSFHGAKKMACSCGAGKWIMYESKCGSEERIEHVHDQINDGYGAPDRFYK